MLSGVLILIMAEACPSGGAAGPFQTFAALEGLKDTDVPGWRTA